jgi:hypothetical protein
MVEHCGGVKQSGNFVHTLTLTDIHSGWTERVALAVREHSLVVEGIDAIAKRLPFVLCGLDTDNDSAFMNETLQGYCDRQWIEWTVRALATRTIRPGSSRRTAWWCAVWPDTGS